MRKLLALLALGLATCATAWPWPPYIQEDTGMGPIEAGDYTALIEGCGNQLVPGYTYCRETANSTANENLVFVGPAVTCSAELPACINFKIYFPNGTPSYGGTIPRGTTRAEVPWSVLLGRTTFQTDDRGFWPYTYEIHYTGNDNNDHVIASEGEIRLRVVADGYTPLNNVPEDTNFVWDWYEAQSGVYVRMTTKGRTFVSEKK